MSQNSAAQPLRQNSLNLLLVCATIFFVFGCFCQSDRDFKTAPIKEATPAPTQTSNVSKSDFNKSDRNQKEDSGDFIVQHGTVQNAKYKEIDQQIKGEKVLENAATELNKNLKLPANIYLRTKDCGEVNALYDPNDSSITICYELMEHFYKLFKTNGKTDDQAYDKMFDAVRFVFLHELGHAMIDLYKLPITGNEEDAADRVSAYICLNEIK